MKIKGTPKEIADLVSLLQNQPRAQTEIKIDGKSVSDILKNAFKASIEAIRDTAEEEKSVS